MNQLWMVAYDIKDDNTRNRVHSLLQNHGERVQYSVFECWLSPQQLQWLRRKVQDEIEHSDSVRWYPLCAWCRKSIDCQGTGSPSEDPPFILL